MAKRIGGIGVEEPGGMGVDYDDEVGSSNGTDIAVRKLRRLQQLLAREYGFKPGDVVQWKPGLRNKRHPEYGQPAIVLAAYEMPLYDEAKDAGSPYFKEPLDIVLGITDDDGDFVMFHYDSRRFQPHK